MTTTAARLARLVTTAGLVLLIGAACSPDAATPPATPSSGASASARLPARPTPSANPTPSPTPPATDPAIVFAADGIGPYVIGTQLTELEGRSLVAGLVDNQLCAGTKAGDATGRYSGQVRLTFTAGRLVSIHTTSAELITPSGAKIGITLADAQTRYGSRAALVTGSTGNKALVVRVPASTLALVLQFDPGNTKVAAMSGGEADLVEASARSGQGC